MNDLVTCVNQMMVRLEVIETLQAVPAEAREPQRNTAMENCDKELKTPPKTRTVNKRTTSTEKETQEKKRSANGGSPMRSKGRFDPVPQGQLDEMKGHHETSDTKIMQPTRMQSDLRMGRKGTTTAAKQARKSPERQARLIGPTSYDKQ
jgi:hypothetical protein